jgi:EpsI family protein
MRRSIRNLTLLGLMLSTAALTFWLQPRLSLADMRPAVDLASMMPATFGDWIELPNAAAEILDPQQQQSLDKLYSQTLSRTYANRQGYRVMLSLVYGKTQRGVQQLHHPEICYPAQGFQVLSNRTAQLDTSFGVIPVRRLETRLNAARVEPVTYWALVGDQVVLGSVRRKLVEVRHGLRGYTVDGLLFRISSVDIVSERAFDQHHQFVTQLLAALSNSDRHRLAGL